VKLKGRLKELADCYSKEPVVWDVGCDHGHLGQSFLGRSEVTTVHLVDPSSDVIQSLHNNKHIDSYISNGKLFIHQAYGQEIKLKSQNNRIFIAGMGGKEIISILQSLEKQSHLLFNCLISPHKNILELREYLAASTYKLRREFLIMDAGRFYQVLDLNFSNANSVSPYGDEIWKGDLGSSYRDYLLNVYESHQQPKDQAYFRFLKSLTF